MKDIKKSVNLNNEKPNEMKTLAKNTIILASPTVLSFIVGILKSKFIAIFLGTTGVGLTNQLLATINMIRQSTLSFLPDGMVKLVAKENAIKSNDIEIYNIIKTYFVMVFPIVILTTILGYVFADEMTKYIFGDIKYKLFFLIGFTAIPVSILGASFRAFLKAFKEIKSFAISDILIIIINLITFLPLIYFFGLIGGIIYITLSFFISFIIVVFLVKKNVFKKYNITFKSIKNAVFSQKYFKEMLAFVGVGLIAGTFRVFENISTRAIVVNNIGIDKLGIYSPITKWEALFIGFILPAVYTYLYPRLSEAKDNKDINKVINVVIRLITFVCLPFVMVGISLRHWVIPLFYSEDFIDAAIYLPYHFSFLLFAIWSTIFEQIFAPTGRLKMLLFFVIITNSISLIMVYYLVPIYGLYGYLFRYTITPFMTIMIFYFYWRKTIDFRIRKENVYVILYALFCSLLFILLKDYNSFILLALSLILILLLVFLLNSKEKNFLLLKLIQIRDRVL